MLVREEHIGFDNAVAVLNAGLEAIRQGDATFDLSEVKRADSAAVAVALDWIREAQKKGLQAKVLNSPESFKKLVQLYRLNNILN